MVIITSCRTPVDCDEATLEWMREWAVDLPRLLCDAGLWKSAPGAVILRRYPGLVPKNYGYPFWRIVLRGDADVPVRWPPRRSPSDGTFETFRLQRYDVRGVRHPFGDHMRLWAGSKQRSWRDTGRFWSDTAFSKFMPPWEFDSMTEIWWTQEGA